MGDGRPLLSLTGTALILSGGFGILQSVSGFLLPHDSAAIGMDAATLSHLGNRPLLHFMFHDRTAYCGTLLAVGSAYWWLAEFPLNAGCEWAWWAYAISGLTGFLSFLAYLQYGYLDTWHACATLLLLPTFFVGLVRSRACFSGPISIRHAWLKPTPGEPPAAKWGRLLLEACAAGLVLAGLTIIAVGMTIVFVPQDFHFIQLSREQLQAISPMLIPVIAHDRSGFGGSVLWLVVREMLILLGGGLIVGVPSAYVLTRYVSSQLFGVTQTDVWTGVAAIALLGLMALASGLVPAQRASAIDPIAALRYE